MIRVSVKVEMVRVCMGSSFRYGLCPTLKLNNAFGVVISLAAHTVCIAGDGHSPPLTLNKPATKVAV